MTSVNQNSPELVVGLVGPVGADLDGVIQGLANAFAKVQYETNMISLSDVIRTLIIDALGTKDIDAYLPNHPEDLRIWAHMTAGNEIRTRTGENGALAIAALQTVKTVRSKASGRRVHIIRSLKSPEELNLFRAVHGDNFVLIAAHCSRKLRIRNLANKIARSRKEECADRHVKISMDLINKDEAETDPFYGEHGQHVREVFPQADLFVDTSDENLSDSLSRFVELLFGTQPFHTPTRDEYAQFQAQAASLRSSNPSRQVGAVITTEDGGVVAIGTNEVPKTGGGLYWCDKGSGVPDWLRKYDSNDQMRMILLRDVLERLKQQGGWLSAEKSGKRVEDLVDESLKFMSEARLMDILEFGRAVHAEMACLMDAARHTVSVQGLTIHCTTLPCHECAKHIIAAGIARVVYIEPYPKSRAEDLFEEAIVVDPENHQMSTEKVKFEPFVGIAPRQYMHLFTFSKSERKMEDGVHLRLELSSTASPPCPRYYQIDEAVLAMEIRYASRLIQLHKRLEEEKGPLETALKDDANVTREKFNNY